MAGNFLLGSSWGRLGASWGRLGAILRRLGALLGRLGAILGRSWGRLGAVWERLEAILGRPGAVLEPSLASLALFWSKTNNDINYVVVLPSFWSLPNPHPGSPGGTFNRPWGHPEGSLSHPGGLWLVLERHKQ